MFNIMKHHLIRRFKRSLKIRDIRETFAWGHDHCKCPYCPKWSLVFVSNCSDVDMRHFSPFSQADPELLVLCWCTMNSHESYRALLLHVSNLALFFFLGFGSFLSHEYHPSQFHSQLNPLLSSFPSLLILFIPLHH